MPEFLEIFEPLEFVLIFILITLFAWPFFA
jgi:hypothetical protein